MKKGFAVTKCMLISLNHRQSLKTYSQPSLTNSQQEYNWAMGCFPFGKDLCVNSDFYLISYFAAGDTLRSSTPKRRAKAQGNRWGQQHAAGAFLGRLSL